MGELPDEVVAAHTALAQSRRIALRARADRERLQQAFANLIESNALKLCEAGAYPLQTAMAG